MNLDIVNVISVEMTVRSGLKGFCQNKACLHANDGHYRWTCKAKGCRKTFKICRTGCHGKDGNDAKDKLCMKCHDHPGGGPSDVEWADDFTEHNP